MRQPIGLRLIPGPGAVPGQHPGAMVNGESAVGMAQDLNLPLDVHGSGAGPRGLAGSAPQTVHRYLCAPFAQNVRRAHRPGCPCLGSLWRVPVIAPSVCVQRAKQTLALDHLAYPTQAALCPFLITEKHRIVLVGRVIPSAGSGTTMVTIRSRYGPATH